MVYNEYWNSTFWEGIRSGVQGDECYDEHKTTWDAAIESIKVEDSK